MWWFKAKKRPSEKISRLQHGSRRLSFESLEGRQLLSAAPSAPVGLAASVQSSSQVRLTWNDSPNETGYLVFDSVNGSNWKPIQQLGANQTSYVAGGLTPGIYGFYIEAFNSSTYANGKPLINISVGLPSAPTLLTPNVVSGSEIDLSWASSARAIGYQIYEWQGGSASIIKTLTQGTTSYAVTNLMPGTNYYFSVAATNLAGSSGPGNWLPATTPALPTAPSLAQPLIVSSSEIDLSWTGSARATGYKVYEWQSGSAVLIAAVGQSTTSYPVKNLSPETTHYFQVAASSPAGQSPMNSWLRATTFAALGTPSLSQPSAVSSSEIDLSWSSVARASNYQIYCSVPGTSWSTTIVVPSSVHQYPITNLSTATTYSFRVVATASNEVSPSSKSMSAMTLPIAANVAKPLVMSSTEINLSWSPAAGAVGYQVMQQGPNGIWGYTGSQLGAGQTSLKIANLISGTTYSFIVRAVNSAGGFTPSQTVTATTDIWVPNVTFVSQLVGHNNELCGFASAAMLLNQRYGAQSTSANTAMIERMAIIETTDKYAEPNKREWGSTIDQDQDAIKAVHPGLSPTVLNSVTFDGIKQLLKLGDAVSIGINYATPGLHQYQTWQGNQGHEVVIVGYSETKGWTYMDPLDPNKGITTVNSAVFQAAVITAGANANGVRVLYLS